MHRFIQDTCADICYTCGVFRLQVLSLKDQHVLDVFSSHWCQHCFHWGDDTFLSKWSKIRTFMKSSEQNLSYIYYIHMYAVVFQCSDRWQLFCLAPSWCLLTVHKRSWLEGQEMSKRPQLVRGHEYLASWKWNWRISFTIIILQGVSHIITGNSSLP